jgi:uncharacterized membrane protein (DUF2068 family)
LHSPAKPRTAHERRLGLKAIIYYKGIKGAAALALAAAGLALLPHWYEHLLRHPAMFLRHHVTGMASLRLAGYLLRHLPPRRGRLICLALGLDGAINIGEWWCLWRGYAWGEWLVVASSGSLLPFEVVELWQGLHFGRALLFVVNLLVIAYLALPRIWPKLR